MGSTSGERRVLVERRALRVAPELMARAQAGTRAKVCEVVRMWVQRAFASCIAKRRTGPGWDRSGMCVLWSVPAPSLLRGVAAEPTFTPQHHPRCSLYVVQPHPSSRKLTDLKPGVQMSFLWACRWSFCDISFASREEVSPVLALIRDPDHSLTTCFYLDIFDSSRPTYPRTARRLAR